MIRKLRPLFNMRSKLEDIPADWMKMVEPRIVRPTRQEGYRGGLSLECWLWDGALDRHGQAIFHVTTPRGTRSMRRVKRFVAAMFWELQPHHDVYQRCGIANCVNPNHLVVTAEHYSHGKRPRQNVHSIWEDK